MQFLKQCSKALAAMIVFSIVLSGPCTANALDDYNTGSSYAKMGDFRLAIKYFDKSIAYHTKSFAEPYVNKGLCLQRLGQHEQAISCYNQALKIQPKLCAAFQNRGTAYLHLNKYSEAVKDFNSVMSLPRPSSLSAVTVYIDRGRAYAGLRKWNESFSDFDYVINMQANSQTMNQLKAAAMREKQKAQLRKAEVGSTGITTINPTATPNKVSNPTTVDTPPPSNSSIETSTPTTNSSNPTPSGSSTP